MCAQRNLRSAWVSAQPDQTLGYPLEEGMGPKLPKIRTAKTLIAQADLSHTSFCWFYRAPDFVPNYGK